MAKQLGCSKEEAQSYEDKYYGKFVNIARFKAKGSKFVKTHGYVLMCKYTGHKMHWWDFKPWLDESKNFDSAFWDDYRMYHKGTNDNIAIAVSKHFKAGSKWDRMALNAVTQGSGIIILKTAMINFYTWIVNNDLFNKVKIVDLVHDEACIEYPETMPEVATKLKECMEKSAAYYCRSLPIPAEAEIGDYWIH